MITWEDIESCATENGFIPARVYDKHIRKFRVCPCQPKEISDAEAEIWNIYLAARARRNGTSNLYSEMFRYEWYEGRKRRGFWGNIEHAIKTWAKYDAPRICVFSAGSGRDLLKVGLAAGIWSASPPRGFKGTYQEINMKYFHLEKPDARIIVTEFGEGNYREVEKTVNLLLKRNLITKDMIYLSRWDFREKAPVTTESQDAVVFSLSGNYAGIDEQPLILGEIARCIRKDGFLITSTLSPEFDFIKAKRLAYRLQFFLKTPLGWPIALDFMRWQVRWAKMAGTMNRRGIWANASADQWAGFLEPAGMIKIATYPAPCHLVPVEVLVAQKNIGGKK
jgi:SAM-dependent methyltransferase